MLWSKSNKTTYMNVPNFIVRKTISHAHALSDKNLGRGIKYYNDGKSQKIVLKRL